MKFLNPRSQACLATLVLGSALLAARPVSATTIAEAGGSSIATAQVIHMPSLGNDTVVTGGVGGDATLIGSGLVTTTGGARQHVSLVGGTPNGQFVLTSASAVGTNQDGTGRQYSDNTFTTEVFFDDDDGPGNYPEFRPGEVTINADGSVHLEFGEFGDDGEITYGYDVIDVTQQTRINDFFRVNGLLAGSDLTSEILSDSVSYGFTDARLIMYDSLGVELFNADADNSAGGNSFLEVGTVTVPADGTVIVEVTQSGSHPVGTYHLAVSGTLVPEPNSLILFSLGGLALAWRRR